MNMQRNDGIARFILNAARTITESSQHDDVAGADIPKVFLGRIGDIKVMLVDEDAVKDKLYLDFTEGGHPGRYRFVPHGHIWIARNLSQKCRMSAIVHELHEMGLMLNDGMNYEDAHASACKVEAAARAWWEKTKANDPIASAHEFFQAFNAKR
jgi:hypothetical protein